MTRNQYALHLIRNALIPALIATPVLLVILVGALGLGGVS